MTKRPDTSKPARRIEENVSPFRSPSDPWPRYYQQLVHEDLLPWEQLLPNQPVLELVVYTPDGTRHLQARTADRKTISRAHRSMKAQRGWYETWYVHGQGQGQDKDL